MGKIQGIRIKNYGSLRDFRMGRLLSDQAAMPLDNMVAIIGPSGNGKSTLADAFGFISDCLETDVEAACDKGNRGGYDQLISQGSDGELEFEIYYRENNNSSPITYELKIGKDKNDRPVVKEERLRQRRPGQSVGRPLSFLHLIDGKGVAYEGNSGGQDDDSEKAPEGTATEVELSDKRKLGIVTLGAMKQYTRIERFLEFLKSWYLCYFTPDRARQIQNAAPAPYLNRTGDNLNNVAQYMYRENKEDFKKILRDIQSKIPNIEKIEPEKLANGQMTLKFYQKGFDKPFYSQRMSDGTLKLFAYYMLLHEKNPRQLVFIEEPENGLYHQYMTSLASEMVANVGSGKYTKQIFVTTHSPFFVNALQPEQVWVLEKGKDGFSTARRASDYPMVKEMIESGAQLGDLWYSKYFGGL